MIQNSRVLTMPEAHRVSPVSARRAVTREDYCAAEMEVPMSTIEQARTFEVAEKAPASRRNVSHANPLATLTRWLNYLGNRRADDSYLKSRLNVPPNFGIGGGIGLY